MQKFPPAFVAAEMEKRPILCEGRNSCRRIERHGDTSYRVKKFPTYAIPALGARARFLNVKITNRLREELAQTAAALYADPSPDALDSASLLTMRYQVEA